MDEYMVTTSDNPFNYYSDFDAWLVFDTSAGYHTLSYLARIVVSNDELSDPDQESAIQQAIDEILEMNINGMYTKSMRTEASAA